MGYVTCWLLGILISHQDTWRSSLNVHVSVLTHIVWQQFSMEFHYVTLLCQQMLFCFAQNQGTWYSTY
jgi:hypothetical protein